MATAIKPRRGGMLKPFGLGWFIREFLLGHKPWDSPDDPQPAIHPDVGASQAETFRWYKAALYRVTAEDRAAGTEEHRAKREKRPIDPSEIEKLTRRYISRPPYRKNGCTYHSFVTYFSHLQRLGWVEFTGREERSEFQDYYSEGPPRKHFRLTEAGKAASDIAWANPVAALYD